MRDDERRCRQMTLKEMNLVSQKLRAVRFDAPPRCRRDERTSQLSKSFIVSAVKHKLCRVGAFYSTLRCSSAAFDVLFERLRPAAIMELPWWTQKWPSGPGCTIEDLPQLPMPEIKVTTSPWTLPLPSPFDLPEIDWTGLGARKRALNIRKCALV